MYGLEIRCNHNTAHNLCWPRFDNVDNLKWNSTLISPFILVCTAKNVQVATSLFTSCNNKQISRCVRMACDKLLTTGPLQVVNKHIYANLLSAACCKLFQQVVTSLQMLLQLDQIDNFVDKLQPAGKIDNVQQVHIWSFSCVKRHQGWENSHVNFCLSTLIPVWSGLKKNISTLMHFLSPAGTIKTCYRSSHGIKSKDILHSSKVCRKSHLKPQENVNCPSKQF